MQLMQYTDFFFSQKTIQRIYINSNQIRL